MGKEYEKEYIYMYLCVCVYIYIYIYIHRNRFKGLDLMDRVPDELWIEVHDAVQELVVKNIPKKQKCKKDITNR